MKFNCNMCFYYNLSKMAQRYKERAQNNEVLRKMDLVNGFTFPEMPVLANLNMNLMHWGLIPFWSNDENIKNTPSTHGQKQYSKNLHSKATFPQSGALFRPAAIMNGNTPQTGKNPGLSG